MAAQHMGTDVFLSFFGADQWLVWVGSIFIFFCILLFCYGAMHHHRRDYQARVAEINQRIQEREEQELKKGPMSPTFPFPGVMGSDSATDLDICAQLPDDPSGSHMSAVSSATTLLQSSSVASFLPRFFLKSCSSKETIDV